MLFSQKESEKINDFKQIARVFLNSENNPEKDKVIAAIFLNIEKYYEICYTKCGLKSPCLIVYCSCIKIKN